MSKFLIKRFFIIHNLFLIIKRGCLKMRQPLFYYSQPVYKLLFHINMLYFKNIHLM